VNAPHTQSSTARSVRPAKKAPSAVRDAAVTSARRPGSASQRSDAVVKREAEPVRKADTWEKFSHDDNPWQLDPVDEVSLQAEQVHFSRCFSW